MCDVCVANRMIAGKIFYTQSRFNKSTYGIKGNAIKPEFAHGIFAIYKDGRWGPEHETEDLAGTVAKGGFDIKPERRKKEMDQFLEAWL